MLSNKIYILDTNLSAIYSESIDFNGFAKLFKKLSEQNNVIITTNSWYEQGQKICELFNTNSIDIICGGGNCIKYSSSPSFEYIDFISKNHADLIFHLAITSYSGVLVKGRQHGNNNINIMTNYFLNYQSAKRFKTVWKFDFDVNNDYVLFNKKISDLDISEIYVFGDNQYFHEKFFNEKNQLNTLLNETNLNVVKMSNNTILFNPQISSKFKLILKYVDKLSYLLNDVIYISLNELEYEGINKYGCIVIPENIKTIYNIPTLLTYNPKNPSEIETKLLNVFNKK